MPRVRDRLVQRRTALIQTQNRWALKVDNPGLLTDVNAVFVTGSSSAGFRLRRLVAIL